MAALRMCLCLALLSTVVSVGSASNTPTVGGTINYNKMSCRVLDKSPASNEILIQIPKALTLPNSLLFQPGDKVWIKCPLAANGTLPEAVDETAGQIAERIRLADAQNPALGEVRPIGLPNSKSAPERGVH